MNIISLESLTYQQATEVDRVIVRLSIEDKLVGDDINIISSEATFSDIMTLGVEYTLVTLKSGNKFMFSCITEDERVIVLAIGDVL